MTSKITLRTLMLCVFIIVTSCPNCNHISQPRDDCQYSPNDQAHRDHFTPSLICFILDDLNEKVLDA